MNLQRISFLSLVNAVSGGPGFLWLHLCHGISFLFLNPCGSCVTCLFLEGHFGIHLEVASGPFCLLVNSPWLLVFALCLFFLSLVGFNIYCWKGIHFSWSNFLIFFYLFFHLLCSFHFWFRDLLREFTKKYEILLLVLFLVFFLFLASEALLFISFFWASFHSLSSPTLGICPGEGFYLPDPCELTFANTLLLSNAAVSLGGAFVSLEISSQVIIFFSLLSFILAWTFVSLQIKEFRIMGLSINDSLYSCLFFFLTGLHFFHLLLGLLLLSLLFWSCSFSFFYFISIS
jgi:heme/copper-type cytochrome/quinol oxidase subunit 3